MKMPLLYLCTRRWRRKVCAIVLVLTLIFCVADPWHRKPRRQIQNLEPYCPQVNSTLPICPVKPIVSDKASFNINMDILTLEELISAHAKDLQVGGHFQPVKCRSKQKVAIVVPYRDRETHLKQLLNNLHPFLKKQDIEYRIIVVEQVIGSKFNRGLLKNIGFTEGLKLCNFDCFFFHDVDLLPDDLGNVYVCGDKPRLHSTNLERRNHKPPYAGQFGGVVSISTEQFTKVNGYPNSYFEWGLEDDELGLRLKVNSLKVIVYPFQLSTYKELTHEKDKAYNKSWKYVKMWQSRLKKEGLNSLSYKVINVLLHPLYTHISVDIDASEILRIHGNVLIANKEDKPMYND